MKTVDIVGAGCPHVGGRIAQMYLDENGVKVCQASPSCQPVVLAVFA